ncbi:proteasome regulatory particle base subunit [Apophysomyces sp. BC1021]|nr:proteasome regulatory particle base subunit [Apophysomyces sp. BC1021]
MDVLFTFFNEKYHARGVLVKPDTVKAGTVTYMTEQQPELQIYALQKLNGLVNDFWAEIADSVAKIEILYEDTDFSQRELAALVASKVYYHLGELDDSLTFALGAGQSFDLSEKSEYVETIISKCIDKYIYLRTQQTENNGVEEEIDPRLQNIVERMFHRCSEDGEYEQAIGIALESRRLDVVKAIVEKGSHNKLLSYVLDVCMTLVQNLEFRNQLMAYQIAFDLEENATQDFLSKVAKGLPKPSAVPEEGNADQKNALESRNSINHSAVTFANAFMHAGTTSDEFLRQNLDWLSRATNWSKFSATAALGVIHKGQLAQSMNLLAPYLPQEGVSGSSSYSEGGSLYALGLINANHGSDVLDFLKNALKNAQSDIIQHGACLGLGVAGMATDNEDIYNELKNALFSDSAVAGEAAGLAMGLVMLGTASHEAIEEMLQYAHETQHEKIIRGLAVGISFIMYGKEEQADGLIKQLLDDKDPVLRYGGIYTIAMAYSGTGSNKAIRRLLHVAVSDVNDDVRRAAVTALGFILLRNPKQVPRIVQLLSESYNPNVRYGSTLALGISCAGTGDLNALELLEPLTKDPVDFVRQGAFISQAMILVQQTENTNPKVSSVRKSFEKIINDKHEDPMAKFGAVLAQGIIDAGGRNVTISLVSRSGHANMPAIIGMAVFTQFWYWHPLTHMLSLAFTPTAIIGLNKNLEIPKFEFISNVKPSLFAYPPAMKPPSATVVEKVATAVLSTTAKAKARAKRSEKEKGDHMDIDKEPAAKEERKEEAKEERKGKKRKEENFEILENMARVVPAQLKHISFKEDSRYVPVKKGAVGGIILVIDQKPGEEEELIEPSAPSGADASGAGSVEEEAPPFEPFEYPADD